MKIHPPSMRQFLFIVTFITLPLQASAWGQDALQQSGFQFTEGQRVHVVAVTTEMNPNFEIERKVKEQFKKSKHFVLTDTPREADFIFFVVIDMNSSRADELALVLLPRDYDGNKSDLSSLRAHAIWKAEEHANTGRDRALRTTTLGISSIFHRPSVSQELVRLFHREALQDD